MNQYFVTIFLFQILEVETHISSMAQAGGQSGPMHKPTLSPPTGSPGLPTEQKDGGGSSVLPFSLGNVWQLYL